MTKSDDENVAFGRPGIHPRWTHGGKDGVGTAYAASSQIWFTLWNGIITEVNYPTVDRPQLRDLQYLISDGKSFFHDEKRHLKHKIERLSDHALGYRCTNSDPDGRYAIVKEIIADPHLACVLQRTKVTGDESFISKLQIYALCAPHLEVGGWENNGYVAELNGRKILISELISLIFRSLRRSVRRFDSPSSGPKAILGKGVTTWSKSNNRKCLTCSSVLSSKMTARAKS